MFEEALFLPAGAEGLAREPRLTLKAGSGISETVGHRELEDARIADKVLSQPYRRRRPRNWEKRETEATGCSQGRLEEKGNSDWSHGSWGDRVDATHKAQKSMKLS